MLACARIGTVYAVVFGGLSPDSLASRIQDCAASLVVTTDESIRGGRRLPLKTNVDAALLTCPSVTSVVVVARTGAHVPMKPGRDHAYAELRDAAGAPARPRRWAARIPCSSLYARRH